MIIILTGKSCSGKDSVSRVLENMGYRSIVSWSLININLKFTNTKFENKKVYRY